MSDIATAQGQQDAGTGSEPQLNIEAPQPTQQSVQQAPPVEPQADKTFYQEILADIEDEVQRKLLEPKVKKWDGQVTQRFQKIHEEYKPYKESGLTVDTVGQAAQLYQMLQSDPQRVFSGLAQALGYAHLLQPQQQAQPVQQQVQPQGSNNQQQLYEDLDPSVAQHIQTLNSQYENQSKMLNQIAQLLVAREKSQQQAQEEANLDYHFQELHKNHGEFDDNYVLTQMYAGMSGEQAVQAYQALVQQAVNQASQANGANQPSPPFMGGGSAPPQDTFDPRKADGKSIKDLVAGLVNAAKSS